MEANSLKAIREDFYALERQLMGAHMLLEQIWQEVLDGEYLVVGELRDGLEQYVQEYGEDWSQDDEDDDA